MIKVNKEHESHDAYAVVCTLHYVAINDFLMIFFITLINISHMNILYALIIVEYACMIALVVELWRLPAACLVPVNELVYSACTYQLPMLDLTS